MLSAKKELFTPSGGGYQISRSVRLRSSASAYLSRTPTSAGNRQKWTYSCWFKRGQLSTGQGLIAATAGTPISFGFGTGAGNDQFFITVSGVGIGTTTPVFRDPSSWYHVVIAFDTTQATSGNRVLIYVNGINYPLSNTLVAQNTNYEINNNSAQQIGTTSITGGTTYTDGYLTEINFIDGQALTPSSFGSTNTVTGVWQPIKYTGTYGTNGFYLNFSDNSAATATTIGKDYSGNGNNWTPNNISVTAGATYDSMIDVPTLYADGGNGRGNYAVLNPIDTNSSSTLSDANLKQTCTLGPSRSVATMRLPNSGKYYAEFINSSAWNSNTGEGFGVSAESVANNGNSAAANSYHFYASASAFVVNNGTLTGISSITNSANQTFQLAADVDNGKVWIGQNNTWYDSAGGTTGNPSTGANATFTIACAGFKIFTYIDSTTSINWQANFGQRPFTYTPPTGFVALNTQNLPTPTISNGATVMAATTYTGDGATTKTIATAVNGVSFQPDFTWVKRRSGASSHVLQDAIRGFVGTAKLASNATDAENNTGGATGSAEGFVSAVSSTGFTVTKGTGEQVNENGATYVGWQWNAGGSTVTNTSGTISSQVRANATAGFSVVTYTGTGANATVGHGLGVAPKMMIFKNRSSAVEWQVYHASAGNGQYGVLNSTAAFASSAIWQNTSPTSSVFSIGNFSGVNTNGSNYVAYCFAAVAGYSAFGKYTGNGSADGPFVFTGFRPRWLMVKNISTAATDWILLDSARDTYNVTTNFLRPNLSNAEGSGSGMLFLSNGFKWQNDTGTSVNQSGATYIYAAFAENPFKLSLAR